MALGVLAIYIYPITHLEAQGAPCRPRVKSASHNPRVAPTVHTMMVERLSTETVKTTKAVAVKAPAEVVERAKSSEAVV